MTATAPLPHLERPTIRPTSLLSQSLAITHRNLIHIKRMPEMLMDVTIQPVMFVVLFAFVFVQAAADKVGHIFHSAAAAYVLKIHRSNPTAFLLKAKILDLRVLQAP